MKYLRLNPLPLHCQKCNQWQNAYFECAKARVQFPQPWEVSVRAWNGVGRPSGVPACYWEVIRQERCFKVEHGGTCLSFQLSGVRDQPGLQSDFLDSQSCYTAKHPFNKTKTNQNKKWNFKNSPINWTIQELAWLAIQPCFLFISPANTKNASLFGIKYLYNKLVSDIC